MKTVATVSQIENGFLVTEYETGRTWFLPSFDVTAIAEHPLSHEAILRNKVMSMDAGVGRIVAIKMVRDYCITHGYDRYRGLKDAKDFVESLRSDWYYRPLNSPSVRADEFED